MTRHRALLLAALLIAMCGIALVWLLIFARPQEIRPVQGPPQEAAEATKPPMPPTRPVAQADRTDASRQKPPDAPVTARAVDTLAGEKDSWWSSGPLVFTRQRTTFVIPRDYNQRIVLRLKNQGPQARRIVTALTAPDEGLLAGFVGPGADGRPLELQPGTEATLSVYLFAQDATRRTYRCRAEAKDAASGELLAIAPLVLFIPLPAFDVSAEVGSPDPGTLALPVVLTNKGGPLTDLRIAADDALTGKIYCQPHVSHANLANGGTLRFRVYPRLHAAFTDLQGDMVVTAAGQQKRVPLHFRLPPGQQVFVASAFCTSSTSAADWYCTNRPNIDVPIGGWPGGVTHPVSNSPFLNQGLWATSFNLGPVQGHIIWGPAPAGVGGGSGQGRVPRSPLPLGLGQGTGSQPDVDPSMSPTPEDLHAGSQSRAADSQAGSYPATGGQQHGPRGGRVRALYAAYRPGIDDDNEAEAMLAYSGGDPRQRDVLQAWHSGNAAEGEGRQVLFRAWDGLGQVQRTRTVRLGAAKEWGQWPAVVALPGRWALVVWETAGAREAPPSLVYRISGPGYGAWSDITPLPGARAEGALGHYDPVAAVGPDGTVVLAWQRGLGPDARVLVSQTGEGGTFSTPIVLDQQPAAWPVLCFDETGGLHLVFHTPSGAAGPSEARYAFSKDCGKSFGPATRLSAQGQDTGEADLLIQGGNLHVVFRAGAAGESRILHTHRPLSGGEWSRPVAVTDPGHYAEYPVLVMDETGGVVAEYFGDDRSHLQATGKCAAEGGVKAKTMIRRYQQVGRQGKWSEPRRLLTRFPTAETAWLQVRFSLRTDRSQYQPHELSLQLNGTELLHTRDCIPEGNYLVRFDPSLLRVDEDGLPHNAIGIRSRHMNQAHYSSAADFRLQGRHRFVEQPVVASSAQEADRILGAESATLNHARPDVGLFAVATAPPPVTAANGTLVEFPLWLGNLGEATATDVRVEVYETQPGPDLQPTSKPLAQVVSGKQLEPFQTEKITVRFRATGKGRYHVLARCRGSDFDPSNNVHTLSLVTPPPEPVAPWSATADPNLVLDLLDESDPPYLVWFFEPQSNREVARAVWGKLSGPLPAGKYHFALQRFQFEGQELRFADVVERTEGEPLHLRLQSALELDAPEWAGLPWRWQVVAASDPKKIVQWQAGQHPIMHLPAGEYLVEIQPSQFYSRPLRWPQTIRLGTDEHVVLHLRSGVQLQLPRWAGDVYSWSVVQRGDPKKVIQEYDAGQARSPVMLLPPGEYQVAVQPSQFYSQNVVWPQTIQVLAGQFTPVSLDSAIGLELPAQQQVYSWSVQSTRDGQKVTQEYAQGQAAHRLMLLPPGEYRVAFQPSQFNSRRVIWPETVALGKGQTREVQIDSGVRLELARGARLFSWGLIAADRPAEPIQHYDYGQAQERLMLVAPGEYVISLRPTQFESREMRWPVRVRVPQGKYVPVALTSGIRFAGPRNTKPDFEFRIRDAGRKEPIQWGRKTWAVQVLPAGVYSIEVRARDNAPWRLLQSDTRVEPGRITEVAIKELPR